MCVERLRQRDRDLALPGQANAGAVLDAGRDIARECALAGGPAETAAGGAGLVDHLNDKPREMPLGKPFIERRRKQKPRRAVKQPEIAHQGHRAGESIAPSTRCV